MNASTKLLLACASLVIATAALAQDIRDDEADVLLTIEREWQASQKGDQDAVDDSLAPEFMGWTRSSPAPRSKTSTSPWREAWR